MMIATMMRSPLPTIGTPACHINVRHAEPGDAAALHAIASQPDVIYNTALTPFAPERALTQRLNELAETGYCLVACIDNDIAGSVCFEIDPRPRLRHMAHISTLAVNSAYRGQGVGKHLVQAVLDLADNWLNVQRIELLVYTDNAAAIKLYERCGFQIEGTLRALAFRAGRYADVYAMGRLCSAVRYN